MFFGTVEAVKTVSDLFLPLSGKITEFNKSLESAPEKVNSDPYGEGWMVKIAIKNSAEVAGCCQLHNTRNSLGNKAVNSYPLIVKSSITINA